VPRNRWAGRVDTGTDPVRLPPTSPHVPLGADLGDVSEDAYATLRAAASGVTFFGTADVYGLPHDLGRVAPENDGVPSKI
jgi:hypothetical protein